MKNKLLLTSSIIALSCVSFYNSSGERESNSKWHPKARINLKIGTERNLGQIGILSPLGQDDVSMLFMDARFMRDSQKNMEGNFGLGYRSLNLIPDKLLGIYGFFDDRYSKHRNLFYQTTLGAELLSVTWDYRLNTYWPLSASKEIKGGPIKKQYIGYELYETSQKEIPLTGLDYEIGRTVPGLEDLTLYAGGYHFGAHHSKGMNGGRFRSVYSFNDYVSVNAEFQYDNIRKYSDFFGVCLTIPIGDDDSKKRKKLSPLERRMTSEVIRDVDIVSNAVKVTHKKEGKYIHIKRGQTGNYTAEQPGQDPLEKPATFKEFVEANNITFVVDERGNVIPVSHYMQTNKIKESSELVKEIYKYPKYDGKEFKKIENDLLTGKTTSSEETQELLSKEKDRLETLKLEREEALRNEAAALQEQAAALRPADEEAQRLEEEKATRKEAERLAATETTVFSPPIAEKADQNTFQPSPERFFFETLPQRNSESLIATENNFTSTPGRNRISVGSPIMSPFPSNDPRVFSPADAPGNSLFEAVSGDRDSDRSSLFGEVSGIDTSSLFGSRLTAASGVSYNSLQDVSGVIVFPKE